MGKQFTVGMLRDALAALPADMEVTVRASDYTGDDMIVGAVWSVGVDDDHGDTPFVAVEVCDNDPEEVEGALGEQPSSNAPMPPGWEARLDVRKREADVADAAVAWVAAVIALGRHVAKGGSPNVHRDSLQRAEEAAGSKVCTAVDALLAARAVAGE